MEKIIEKAGGKIQLERGVSVTHPSANVCVVYFDHVSAEWEQWILLSSDRHHDSKWCDRSLEREHLDKVVARKGWVIDVGDWFDVMQGRYDPRRTYKDLRKEYTVEHYLDEIVVDAAEFFSPYAGRILMMGRGNHDQQVLKNCGTDILSNLVHRLNYQNKAHIQAGGYGGWVHFHFKINKTLNTSVKLKYFHGSGGGGPVTRGVIQSNRQAVFLPDAQIVVNGHTHDSWHVPIARERLNDAGRIEQDLQHHIRTSTYKHDYGDGSGGWFVETGKAPRPIGAVWLHFMYDRRGVKMEFTQDVR